MTHKHRRNETYAYEPMYRNGWIPRESQTRMPSWTNINIMTMPHKCRACTYYLYTYNRYIYTFITIFTVHTIVLMYIMVHKYLIYTYE